MSEVAIPVLCGIKNCQHLKNDIQIIIVFVVYFKFNFMHGQVTLSLSNIFAKNNKF